MCERKIKHICDYRKNNRLLIIAHDYHDTFFNNLNSSINDITIVWNYFRRNKCLKKDQIYIHGKLDINGKMIPWKNRYFENSPTKDIYISSNYIYYTGHGYDNGTFDDYKIETNSESLHIIDSCYSYLWDKKMKGMMSSTDGIKSFICISMNKCSIFTLKLFTLLEKIYFKKKDIELRKKIELFFEENNFFSKGNYESILYNN